MHDMIPETNHKDMLPEIAWLVENNNTILKERQYVIDKQDKLGRALYKED